MARVGLVLAGGAARGAYEVGVVQHIVEDVARDLGRDVPLDILCGTSVGAINVGLLAAFADEPRARGERLRRHWTSIRLEELVRLDVAGLLAMARNFVGLPVRAAANARRRGGLLDPTGLERVIADAIPFKRIAEHLRAGRLAAVTMSATHVGTGRTVVFVARDGGLPAWSNDPLVVARHVELQADHALASAALPLLFPAVRIGGHFYCDGGLRQNVPLSPARRLGADGLIVVNPRHVSLDPIVEHDNEEAFPGPLFLLGKTLNALLLDRIESDIDRLDRINAILLAGTRRYGAQFVDEINHEMSSASRRLQLRPMRTVLIRASADIGRLSAEFVRASSFRRRVRGTIGRLIRRIAEGEARSEADLLSYLLFDGEFAGLLIELGRADARARHAELCTFFNDLGSAPHAGP